MDDQDRMNALPLADGSVPDMPPESEAQEDTAAEIPEIVADGQTGLGWEAPPEQGQEQVPDSSAGNPDTDYNPVQGSLDESPRTDYDYGQGSVGESPRTDYSYGQGNPGESPHTGYDYGQSSSEGSSRTDYNYGQSSPKGTPYTDYNYGPNGQNTSQQHPPYGSQGQQDGFRQGYGPHIPQRGSNYMAIASLVLGILSILMCCCGGFGIILGAVGIVLAILSRGREPMETNAKVGIGLSIGGIVLSIIILALAFAVADNTDLQSELYRRGYGDSHGNSHSYEDFDYYFDHNGL